MAALGESAALLESAAEAASVPDELRLKSRANLAGVLNLRARHTGERAYLERAIAVARDVATTPATDPARPGRLSLVAGSLRLLAYWTHDSGLARDAVAVQRSAIAAHDASADGVPPWAFSDLGLYLADVQQPDRGPLGARRSGTAVPPRGGGAPTPGTASTRDCRPTSEAS